VLRLSLRDKEAKRFLEEAQTLVRLKHSHIVRVLDFAVEQGAPVLVMDYAPGGTLRQRHPRGTSLALTTVASYVQQIAAALQYAHNQHVIHRDVKPENLLLGSDHRLLLSDFGLALFAPSLDVLSTQELTGTLPYTAPEQLCGKPGFASDQYALGIVTYEWLCGRRPFEGRALELIQQHLSAAPPPLREYYPELPPAIEQVVLRALEKDPQQRYVSIQAFAQALERACREQASEEDISQVTAPLPAISRSSLTLSAPSPIFLSAAPADELVATRLQADLQLRGILFSNEKADRLSQQEDAMRQAIRAADLVLVGGTPGMPWAKPARFLAWRSDLRTCVRGAAQSLQRPACFYPAGCGRLLWT
jgi:serine/threonine protein kinase